MCVMMSTVPCGSTQTALIGTAGDYYGAAQLSERCWHATITIKNAPNGGGGNRTRVRGRTD